MGQKYKSIFSAETDVLYKYNELRRINRMKFENGRKAEWVKWYRGKIVEMVGQIENEKFLNQICTILKKHIEKRGG